MGKESTIRTEKEVAVEAKKEEKMEMGLKEAAAEARKEEKMVMGLKEVEA